MIKLNMKKLDEPKGNTVGFINLRVELSNGYAYALRGVRVVRTKGDELVLRMPFNTFKKGEDTVQSLYFRLGKDLVEVLKGEFAKFLETGETMDNVDLELYDGKEITTHVNSVSISEDQGGRLRGVLAIKFNADGEFLYEVREILKVEKSDGENLFVFPSYMGANEERHNIHYPLNAETREFLVEDMENS